MLIYHLTTRPIADDSFHSRPATLTSAADQPEDGTDQEVDQSQHLSLKLGLHLPASILSFVCFQGEKTRLLLLAIVESFTVAK